MPKITQDRIGSETKWITMVATKDTYSKEVVSSGRYIGEPRNWYLTIHVNGIHLEFIASEGSMLLFTAEEAVQRIEEFENIIDAENKHYTHELVDKALMLLK